jgi:hypothetical protein
MTREPRSNENDCGEHWLAPAVIICLLAVVACCVVAALLP